MRFPFPRGWRRLFQCRDPTVGELGRDDLMNLVNVRFWSELTGGNGLKPAKSCLSRPGNYGQSSALQNTTSSAKAS